MLSATPALLLCALLTTDDKIKERFIGVEGSITEAGKRIVRSVELDFAAGKRDSHALAQIPSNRSIETAIYGNGRVMIMYKPVSGEVGREVLGSADDAVIRAAAGVQSESFQLISGSPDGQKLAGFDPDGKRILLIDKGSIKAVPFQWVVSHPFSWSHDSSAVAFYFARTQTGDDSKFQEHGVGIVTLDGTVRIVSSPDPERGTPLRSAKDVPIGWASNGEALYFTEGRLEGDAPADPHLRRMHMRPSVTVRAALKDLTHKVVASGEFCDVSPDDTYIFTYGPATHPEDKPAWACWKVDLGSGSKHQLPDVIYPKISRSGKLAAGLKTDELVVCFRTDTLETVGQPVNIDKISGRMENWFTDYCWTIAPAASQPATPPEP